MSKGNKLTINISKLLEDFTELTGIEVVTTSEENTLEDMSETHATNLLDLFNEFNKESDKNDISDDYQKVKPSTLGDIKSNTKKPDKPIEKDDDPRINLLDAKSYVSSNYPRDIFNKIAEGINASELSEYFIKLMIDAMLDTFINGAKTINHIDDALYSLAIVECLLANNCIVWTSISSDDIGLGFDKLPKEFMEGYNNAKNEELLTLIHHVIPCFTLLTYAEIEELKTYVSSFAKDWVSGNVKINLDNGCEGRHDIVHSREIAKKAYLETKNDLDVLFSNFMTLENNARDNIMSEMFRIILNGGTDIEIYNAISTLTLVLTAAEKNLIRWTITSRYDSGSLWDDDLMEYSFMKCKMLANTIYMLIINCVDMYKDFHKFNNEFFNSRVEFIQEGKNTFKDTIINDLKKMADGVLDYHGIVGDLD